jgi:Holliday junction DNA helicase RuvA
MIGRLSGLLAAKNPSQLLIDVGGVGYEVDVPMSTFYNLPALGERVTLLTHFVVREDAQVLFGFLTPEERATFRLLVKISGVGPRTALSILSGLGVSELAQAVTLQETGRLIKVPGIGKKTAERLVVELRDKLEALPLLGGAEPAREGGLLPRSERWNDAVAALTRLGYTAAQAQEAVRRAAGNEEDPSLEQLVRRALALLGKPATPVKERP